MVNIAKTVFVEWFFFFFSSRRRHTRLQGDWSSDVCSSDLELEAPFHLAVVQLEHVEWLTTQSREDEAEPLLAEARETFERLGAKPWLERIAQDRKSVV